MKTNIRRSNLKKVRTHGFRARMATKGGRAVLARKRRRNSTKGKKRGSGAKNS